MRETGKPAVLRAADPEIGRTVHVGDVATNYHDVGRGPVVLLLHGSGPGVSAWANWRGVIPELSQKFRVVAPDIMGFGYTRTPAGSEYGVESWSRHLTGFCDALELDRFSVVGNSFGGSMALRLATEQPRRVEKLVLMGSVGVRFTLTPGLDRVWGFTPSIENMRGLLDLFAYDRSRLTDELATIRLAAATRPGVQEAFAAMFPAPRQAGVDSLVVDEEKIATLGLPTLIMHGRDDQVIPLATSMRLHELVSPSQLHVFGECGHWVQIEQRDRFVALVSQFLAE
ncbi:MAG: alpha/beta fold hydrolase [Pseudonocardia sp.]|nr:alpha/beta fold hydrolase [Pseudonocardia sp.]